AFLDLVLYDELARRWSVYAGVDNGTRAKLYALTSQIQEAIGDVAGAMDSALAAVAAHDADAAVVTHDHVEAILNLSRLYLRLGQVERSRAAADRAFETSNA